MIEIYTAVLVDPRYRLDIKAPIDAQLASSGVIKDSAARKRKRESAGESAGQKRAAAREAAGADDDGADDDDESGGAAAPWWLHGDGAAAESSSRGAKRARRESGGGGELKPSSKGRGGGGGGGSATKDKGKAATPTVARLARLAHDWPVGCAVEVLQETDEHFGALFLATVAGHKAPDKAVVVYDELLEDNDDEDIPLRQPEPTRNLRPAVTPLTPPSHDHAAWAAALREGDLVQFAFIGGWWDVRVMAADGGTWTVKSIHFEAEHAVDDPSLLRPPPQWHYEIGAKAWTLTGHEDAVDEALEELRAAAVHKKGGKAGAERSAGAGSPEAMEVGT